MFIKHQLTENVKLLQKAVIIRSRDIGREVLILKRSSESVSRPSCWDLPGGNSEWPAENQMSSANLHLTDLQREILEETALTVDINDLSLDKLVHFSTYFESEKQIFTMIAGWLIDYATTDQNEVRISNEHQEYAWVSEADLPNYDFGGAKGSFILDIIQNSFAKI